MMMMTHSRGEKNEGFSRSSRPWFSPSALLWPPLVSLSACQESLPAVFPSRASPILPLRLLGLV